MAFLLPKSSTKLCKSVQVLSVSRYMSLKTKLIENSWRTRKTTSLYLRRCADTFSTIMFSRRFWSMSTIFWSISRLRGITRLERLKFIFMIKNREWRYSRVVSKIAFNTITQARSSFIGTSLLKSYSKLTRTGSILVTVIQLSNSIKLWKQSGTSYLTTFSTWQSWGFDLALKTLSLKKSVSTTRKKFRRR